MELSEKIRWVEAFLMGELEGQQLAEYERLRQENTITRQEIERIRKAKSDLATVLIQRKVLATLDDMRQERRQKSVKLLQRGAMASVLMAAACIGMLYLTYSPIELRDPLVDSINKGADMPNSTAVDTRQEEALTLFTQGRQYLESEQPVLAVQSFERVLTLKAALNERFIAFTEYNLSVAYLKKEAPAMAAQWYNAANSHGLEFKSIGWLTKLKMRWQIFWMSMFE